MIEQMNFGHIFTAKVDYDMDITQERATEISEYDIEHNICIGDDNGCYIVIQKTPRITGDIYVLTKLFCPQEKRGNGYISKLLDRAPTPLTMVTQTEFEGIRI